MSNTITVACIKWGAKYGDSYVRNLERAIETHLAYPFEFVCFTERPVSAVHCRPLPTDWPGWWAKLGLFKPGLFHGPTLYLDLDVVVLGDLGAYLREAATDRAKLWALDDFSYSLRAPKDWMDEDTRRLLGGIGTCNSSVMCWRGDVAAPAYERFREHSHEIMHRLHGDQNHLTQTLWPERLALFSKRSACSYKYDVRDGGEPFGAVCVFHGEPKCTDLPDSEPLRRLWEGRSPSIAMSRSPGSASAQSISGKASDAPASTAS